MADYLRRSIQLVLAAATTVVACSMAAADAAMTEDAVDLLVTSIVATDGDVLERLPAWTADHGGVKRAFVVTELNHLAVRHALAQTNLAGVFDPAAGGMDDFAAAFAVIAAGGTYWSPSMTASWEQEGAALDTVFRRLSPTERMVLGIIGDGCDDATAARKLTLSEKTVRSVRGSLHRKLGFQHKGDLIAFAAENGFVIHTRYGVIRPGLAALMAEREAARRIMRLPRAPLPVRQVGTA